MSSNVRIELLTKDNYDTWKVQVQALLTKNDAWTYVNGSKIKPEVTPTNAELVYSWESGDEKAKADLILAISPGELKHIRGCNTAREVWLKLESIYASKGPAKKATLLKQLTLQRMKEGDDVHEHMSRFFGAVDKLSDMDVKINEDLLSIMLLYSLPASYENFRCAIETRDSLPTVDILKIKILEEDSSRKQSSKLEIQGAMYANRRRQQDQRKFRSKMGGGQETFRFKCFKCHQLDHKAFDCKMKSNKYQERRCVEEEEKAECIDDSFVLFLIVTVHRIYAMIIVSFMTRIHLFMGN